MLDKLTAEWQTWCAKNGFPQLSADELFLEVVLSDEQKSYVEDFIERWDQAEKLGGNI